MQFVLLEIVDLGGENVSLIVLKFGGTSVADVEKMFNAAKIITEAYDAGNSVVAVVSAQGRTTDQLIDKAKEINDTPSLREMDVLLSTGEQVSIALLAMAIEKIGYPVVSLTGLQAGITTDSNYGNAKVRNINSKRILKELEDKKIVIVAGFQGIDCNGDITTLGRGGSDTTAVALAAVLKADVCEIYTDVGGVYTADPKIVKDAAKLDNISYDEMLELASVGAKVLHNRSVELAKRYNVNLIVKSCFKRDSGTKVKETGCIEDKTVRGVAKDDNIAKVAVIGMENKTNTAFKLFSVLAKHNIDADIIVQTEGIENTNNIYFTVKRANLSKTISELKRNIDVIGAKKIESNDKLSKVSIVGAGIVNTPGVAAQMFEALDNAGIYVHLINKSEMKISVIVDEQFSETAVKAIHDKFKLGDLIV